MAPATAITAWLPWAAGVVVVAVVGTVLGAAGAFGRSTEQVTVVSAAGVLPESALAMACPGGAVLDELYAGTRVLAIARSDDSGHLGVRDPDNFSRTLWVDAESVTIDSGQADVASLPTGACAESTITLEPTAEPTAEPSAPAPTPTDPAPNQPPPPPPPPPASDATAPTIQQKSATPTTIYCRSNVGPTFPGTTLLRMIASDNAGVTSAAISWSGYNSGSGSMNLVGGEWQYSYTEASSPLGSGTLTFTLTPRDAAGNTTSTTVAVAVTCFG